MVNSRTISDLGSMRLVRLLVLVLAIGAAGCSTQQLERAGEAWRKSFCNHLIGEHYRRCLAEASGP